ncbi:MAG: hypothetical protein JNK87_03875 [Bryobacterales bacterium]|nr:hypothetical protein [Bryobacterales bacterium]
MKAIARRARRRSACTVGRALRAPFPALVRHFLRRMARPADYTSADDPELGAGFLLGLLATPGAVASLLLLDKYSSILSWFRGRLKDDLLVVSAPDKLLFLCLSMAITGVVATLRWDRLLPDAQDYATLAPLPISPRLIFAANITAIALGAMLIAVTVNAASALLFPMFVSAASPDSSIMVAPFLAVHAACVFLASLFAFVFVMAVLGAATCLAPGHALDAVTNIVRAVLVTGWAALLPATLGSGSLQTASPATWFLAVYQQWQHRGPALLEPLASRAWLSLALAFAVGALSYVISYTRRFRSIPESEGVGSASVIENALVRAVDASLAWQSPLDRALSAFTLRGLWRNPMQRLAVTVPWAFGWLVVWNANAPALTFCLLPALLLTLGIRTAVQLPAALRANGIFRLLLDGSMASARTTVRQIAIAGAFLLVGMPAVVMAVSGGTGAVAVIQALAIAAGFALLHIDLVLASSHRIPFTSPLPGFSERLPATCFLQVLAVILSLYGAARAETVASRHTWVAAIPLLAWAVVRIWGNRAYRLARADGHPDLRLSFEAEDPSPVVAASFTTSGPAAP